jgi:hypothetical protein
LPKNFQDVGEGTIDEAALKALIRAGMAEHFGARDRSPRPLSEDTKKRLRRAAYKMNLLKSAFRARSPIRDST